MPSRALGPSVRFPPAPCGTCGLRTTSPIATLDMRPDDTFVTPSAVRSAGKPTSLPTDDTVRRPRNWTLERRARSAIDGSGLTAWTQCRTYGPEPPSNLRDTTRTGSRTRRSGHVPQPDSADTTLPPYRRDRSVLQQSGPARRCPRHRDRPPGEPPMLRLHAPAQSMLGSSDRMTVLLPRCLTSLPPTRKPASLDAAPLRESGR
jgi:hypothetical protein